MRANRIVPTALRRLKSGVGVCVALVALAAAAARAAGQTEAAPQSQPLKLKPSQWIVRWQGQGKYDRVIRRLERLLRDGPRRQAAAVSAGLKQETGKDLVTTLIAARIEWAAIAGKMAQPTQHERPRFAPMAEDAARKAATSSRVTLARVRAQLRAIAAKDAKGIKPQRTEL